MKELGIYVHIPFCKKKCAYCDFISFENKLDLEEKYIGALKKEIDGIKIADEYIVTTIYIGGGTPSIINPAYIGEILNCIKNKFQLLNPEITMEVNPGTVTREKLEKLYNLGVNRLSIGLQSVSNQLLKLIGRIHAYEQFLDSYNLAREIGFKNINIDLMIGLPTQDLEDIEDSLDKVISLNPEHISVYSLILEEGTILKKKVDNGELALPPETIERKMYWKVKERLEEAGYIHYEISNFAKKGYESKHNLNCWNQKEYIGFGLAAHSYLENKRYSNIENLEEYIEGIENNKDIKTVHEEQTEESKMKEYMLLGLRKIEGVNISQFKTKFVHNPVYVYRNELNKLVKEELLEVEDDNIKLTNKGIDLANIVWEEFV